MNIQIENTEHLTADEQILVRHIARQSDFFKSLDHAQAEVQGWTGWTLYRGGNHIALHRVAGDDKRILIITEGEQQHRTGAAFGVSAETEEAGAGELPIGQN